MVVSVEGKIFDLVVAGIGRSEVVVLVDAWTPHERQIGEAAPHDAAHMPPHRIDRIAVVPVLEAPSVPVSVHLVERPHDELNVVVVSLPPKISAESF
jgi:hypothetical protein